MDSSLYTSLRSQTAWSTTTRALDFGNSWTTSNKARRNQIIGENLLRKSAQLVEDIVSINAARKSLQSGASSSQKSGLTPLEYAENQLTSSIRAILDLRAKLGIETPAGTLDKNTVLRAISGENKGTLFDTQS